MNVLTVIILINKKIKEKKKIINENEAHYGYITDLWNLSKGRANIYNYN